MTKPIVVGYDPKILDRAPVEFAITAARFAAARLIVACVCADRRVDEDLAESGRGALDDLSSELDTEGVDVEWRELTSSSAARALHEFAEAEDAGLLVVGSTTRGTIGRVLPGSTAERLMHGAICPLAVVPRGWTPGDGLNTVGVAYVDSEEGHAALSGAHALARRGGARLRVLTVAKVPVELHAETEAPIAGQRGREFSEIEGEQRVEAENAARATVEALGNGIEVEVDAFLGDPADSIIRVSEHLDLLVCGSRGYGPMRAVLLGGVSRRVTADARCPVVVLPRGVGLSLD